VGVNRWEKEGIVILHFIPLLGKTTTQVVSFFLPDLVKFALFGGRSRPNKWTLDFSFFGLVFLGKAKRYHNKKEWGGRIIFLFSSFAAKVFSFLFSLGRRLCVVCRARAESFRAPLSLDSCNPAGRFRLTRSRNRKRVSLRQQQWVQLVIHPGEEKEGEMHRQIDRRLIRLAWHRRE
jgi:hypothetical protein